MNNNSLNILYEDNDILVCVKPAGIATESANIRTNDMVSLIKQYLGKGNPYLGLVHRLDQPVSGILVFAKTSEAATNLSKQLQTSDMGKHYSATVQGEIQNGTYTLRDYLVKDGKKNKALVVSRNQKGPDGKPAKEATLNLTVLSYDPNEDTTIIKVKLLTGRFHQIRAQLSHFGHPILFDVKYGAKAAKDKRDGIALCADELHFKHPRNGKIMDFSI